jgi:hypothetical protein
MVSIHFSITALRSESCNARLLCKDYFSVYLRIHPDRDALLKIAVDSILGPSIEKEFFEHVRPSSLLERFGTVDEVGAIATFVASKLSSATNGAPLRVDAAW